MSKLRQYLSILPEFIKYPIYRQYVDIEHEIDPDYTLGVATSPEDIKQALALLHEEYVRAGLMKPSQAGLRVTPYHVVNSTHILILKKDDKVIATVSVVKDGKIGLPLEDSFDISHLKNSYMRVAEISALAIDKDYRDNRGKYLWPLLKFLYEFCRFHVFIRTIVIAVHPRHYDFYKGLLCFNDIKAKRVEKHDFANGAPARAGYLDLGYAFFQYHDIYGKKADNKNLFKYFTEEQTRWDYEY